MEDYYAILGLDPGASQESIKLAYRRLAREHHPDRKINSTETEKKGFSAQMVKLNGAYAVLSDIKQRREYDQKLKIINSLQTSTTVSPASATKTATVTTKTKTAERGAPRNDVDSTLAEQYSKQLRTNFLEKNKTFSWEEKSVEGFDWGLETSSWSSHYCVAGRGFAVLNPASAKKFTNYADVVIARSNRAIRKSHFLFLLPFQRLNEWDSVSAEFNRFLSASGHNKLSSIPVAIVLLDARQGRTMKFGSQVGEKRLEEMMQTISATSV